MHYPHTNVRRERPPAFLAPHPRRDPLNAGWREGAALAGAFLVLLVTAWLFWGALAERTLALAAAQ
jgi:hypothetical protein